jgi:transcriptional regulator with XRE-family HTH domain
MNMQTVIATLRKRCQREGQAEVARQLGVSSAYICRVLNGERRLGPKIIKALGLRIELTNGR